MRQNILSGELQRWEGLGGVFSEVRVSSRALRCKLWGQHQPIPAAATRWQPDKILSAIPAEMINSVLNS